MAKTTFIDGNQSQGIQGTRVTADILNAINNHRHTGADVDGHGALDYAADTGTGNAYVITLNPALTAYITGMPISFKAAHTNTGATTLNVNGLGAKTIRIVDQALAAGQIKAGQIVTVVYDGTYFQMISSPSAQGPYIGFYSHATSSPGSHTFTTGFKPSVVIFLVAAGDGSGLSAGFDDGTTHIVVAANASGVYGMDTQHSFRGYDGSIITFYGNIQSLNSDGFTIEYEIDGPDPTYTISMCFLAFKG